MAFSVEIATEEAGGSAPGLAGLQKAGKATHGNTSGGHYRAGSMYRLRELNQMHNTWRWNHWRQEMSFGEWKWTAELMGMARMVADVRFEEVKLQLSEASFQQWTT